MLKNPLVFDSWPILAYLQDELPAPIIEGLIHQARKDDIQRWISAVNLGEVWYNLASRNSEAEADDGIQEILELGIEIVDTDWDLALQAAKYKARYRIS